MDIGEDAGKGDMTLEGNGLKVVIEREADILLSEATIDFSIEWELCSAA